MTPTRPVLLIVDDVIANVRLLGEALKADGATLFATSGPEALRVAEAQRPDLVLLDVMMPGMDGYETCERLRALPSLASIPVIFVTALGEPEAERRGLALGAADYIVKPYNMDLVRLRVRNLLERARLQRELEAQCALLERRVAERTAELAASEAKFRALVEQSLTGIFLLEDGFFRYANQRFAEIFGYASPAELVGRVPFLDLVAPENRTQVAESLQQRAAGSVDSWRYEFTGLRRDGGRVELEAHDSRVAQGGRPAVIGALIDISERRAAEAARESALAAAEHLARLKNEFMANMNHELRTPLQGALGWAALGMRVQDLAKAQQGFERIAECCRRLAAMVDDIADFSSLDAGHLALEPGPVDLGKLLAEAADAARSPAEAKGLCFAERRAADLPSYCLADGRRLAQVLSILLSNAVKFTDQGRVEFAARRAGERLSLRIADTGIGMEPAFVERLFRPFEQADGSSTRRFGGAGLGLALCWHLVRKMGGSLQVETAPGQGAAFEVSLPLVEAQSMARPGPEVGDTRLLAGVSVLAVDDNEFNRMVIEDMLEAEGAQVALAADGRAALERLDREGAGSYHIVLTDLRMPGMDGCELAAQVRALDPALPVLGVVSERVAGEERERLHAAGIVDVLLKPISMGELIGLVLRHRRTG
jgi:two-component system sensor histidine kinase/response regulator